MSDYDSELYALAYFQQQQEEEWLNYVDKKEQEPGEYTAEQLVEEFCKNNKRQ